MPRMPSAIEAFKKTSPTRLNAHLRARRRSTATTPIEIWFQDEARIGQKNKPHPPMGIDADPVPALACLISATESTYHLRRRSAQRDGKGAALAFCPALTHSEAMQLHLADIAAIVAHRCPRRSACSIKPDGTYRRQASVVPRQHHALSPLPSHARPSSTQSRTSGSSCAHNWLSNRIFEILRRDHRRSLPAKPGNKLVAQPLSNHIHRFAPLGEHRVLIYMTLV